MASEGTTTVQGCERNQDPGRPWAADDPLVSVIIPTRNRGGRLPRALASVQRQTYPRLEIIVVDDASEDGTPEIVAQMKDPRIRYERHDTNRGGAAARNTGIRAATGEIIGFLDDDDQWEPEKTAEQLKLLRHYDVVVCTTTDIDRARHRLERKQVLDLRDLRRGPFGGTGVLMAKAFVLKEIMFDESLPRGQDWDLFIRIALKYTIGYLNRPLLRYDDGNHRRITNRLQDVPLGHLEQEFEVVRKHRMLFGERWYRKHMAHGLLYGLSRRNDKAALLVYTARRYGIVNVAQALSARVLSRAVRAFSVRPGKDLPEARRAGRTAAVLAGRDDNG